MSLFDLEFSHKINLFPISLSLLKISTLNLLPNDQILDITKLKVFAHDKLNVDKKTISLLNRVENTEGKGENAGNQHFLLPRCFPKPSSLGSFKLGIVW